MRGPDGESEKVGRSDVEDARRRRASHPPRASHPLSAAPRTQKAQFDLFQSIAFHSRGASDCSRRRVSGVRSTPRTPATRSVDAHFWNPSPVFRRTSPPFPQYEGHGFNEPCVVWRFLGEFVGFRTSDARLIRTFDTFLFRVLPSTQTPRNPTFLPESDYLVREMSVWWLDRAEIADFSSVSAWSQAVLDLALESRLCPTRAKHRGLAWTGLDRITHHCSFSTPDVDLGTPGPCYVRDFGRELRS